jgi:tetratricopeptide (TPR) repeat protein
MSLMLTFIVFYLGSALLALSVSPVAAQQLSPDPVCEPGQRILSRRADRGLHGGVALKPRDGRLSGHRPSFTGAYNNRVWAYFKAGKAADGVPDVQRALELNSNNADALDTRGHILEVLGRREEASADFRRALSIDLSIQNGRDALRRLGIVRLREGDGWFLA